MLTNMAISANPKYPAWIAAMMIINLLQNPFRGGIPAILIEPIRLVLAVTGKREFNPPKLFKLRLPVEYSMAPEFKKSKALKIA